MNLKRLRETGVVTGPPIGEDERGKGYLERDALLVYVGEFESMDGPVNITGDHVDLLCKNFNERAQRRLAQPGSAEGVVFRECPPVQVDHSSSAQATVGRLVGPLRVADVQFDKGVFRFEDFVDDVPVTKGLCGPLRFLGEENCAKAADGRWTHLSIGADLDEGEIRELTVTPFPAAPNASLLSQIRGAAVDTEKLKKHLMETEKCSAEEADEKLSKMSDEDKSKLSADITEKEKLAQEPAPHAEPDGDEEGPAKMRAAVNTAKKRLSKLLSGSVTQLSEVRLAVRKQDILTRLSRFRAEGKVTPAELKKMNFDKLAARGDEAIETLMSAFAAREPVIHIGQFGSLKSLDLSAIAAASKHATMSAFEAEARAQMTSIPKKTNLAEGDQPPPAPPSPSPAAPAAPKLEQDQMTQVLEQIEAALGAGDVETAMKYVQALRAAVAGGVEQPVPAPVQEAAMSAITKQVSALTNAFSEMTQICEALEA